MRQALDASGRPIVFSICEWGTNKPWLWANGIGNLWRTTGDISDVWASTKKDDLGVVDILDKQVGLESFAGPGHWNDPDMLEVGNGGMTVPEYRAHFSLWSLLASPLMAGNDLRDMKPEIQQILTNKEVIAVNQDPLGKQGRRVHKDGELEVWAKQMQDGGRAVILLNRGLRQGHCRFVAGDWLPRASECGGTRSVAGERFGGVQGKILGFGASAYGGDGAGESVERARKARSLGFARDERSGLG